jgi:hypothetical protein
MRNVFGWLVLVLRASSDTLDTEVLEVTKTMVGLAALVPILFFTYLTCTTGVAAAQAYVYHGETCIHVQNGVGHETPPSLATGGPVMGEITLNKAIALAANYVSPILSHSQARQRKVPALYLTCAGWGTAVACAYNDSVTKFIDYGSTWTHVHNVCDETPPSPVASGPYVMEEITFNNAIALTANYLSPTFSHSQALERKTLRRNLCSRLPTKKTLPWSSPTWEILRRS